MGWGVFLVCWAMAAVTALALGRDTSWDLRNYHYYNPWALLEGRWAVDLAPAGVHSFLHPGLDIPFYLLTRTPLNAYPRLVAVLQAGYGGTLVFLVLAVANLACSGTARRATATSLAVACFGLSGAATLPEAGTTYNDIQIGCLVVGAVLALLLAPGQGGRRAARLHLLAGALGGCAMGLKLTALVFPPALVLASLAIAPRRTAARSVLYLVVGGVLGFAVTYGPWAWFLWDRFETPFGPFLNALFQSPMFAIDNQRDGRFLPAGLWQALIYPFLWARRSEGLVIEPTFADPRFSVGMTALLVAACLAVWCRLRGVSQACVGAKDLAGARARRGVLVFIAAAYALWLASSSILRYAVPIEVLLGVPVWEAARQAWRLGTVRAGSAQCFRTRRFGPVLTSAGALALCAAMTEYPSHPRESFGRQPDLESARAVWVDSVVLAPDALVVMLGPAVSFVAPFLSGDGTRFVAGEIEPWAGSPSEPASYAARIVRTVRSHSGPAYVVLEFADDYNTDAAAALGIHLDRGSCHRLPNSLTTAVQLCRWR